VRNLAQAAVPHMLSAPAPRSGRIVAIASSAGTLGLQGLGAYAAAKHAVVGYVRALAADLGDSGITANVVSPGSTRTAMLEASARLYGLHDVDELGVHHAIGRVLEPGEPAAAVAWLCSPAASGMTGAVVAVDGGMTAVR
jgi:NAD(P)-dependent dehydrogenase (short-subunit alcohol dehydrogenase family)